MTDLRCRMAATMAMLLLGACASAPVRFHTLAGTAGLPPPAASPALAFMLDPVSVPRQVDIPQLVVRGSDGALRLAENQRWLAPLGDEIRAALSQTLQARLGAADVSRVPAAAGTTVIRVKLDVQRFDALPGGQTLVSAQWSLRDLSSPAVLASCTSQATESAAPGYEGLVAAYRRGLERIAGAVAAGIAQGARGPGLIACAAGEVPASP